MSADRGVIYVLLDHFSRHLYPRAVEIEKRLNAGARLGDEEIAHVSEVLEEMRLMRPLIDRHPEHAQLVAGVVALYAGIARHARQNESSSAAPHTS